MRVEIRHSQWWWIPFLIISLVQHGLFLTIIALVLAYYTYAWYEFWIDIFSRKGKEKNDG